MNRLEHDTQALEYLDYIEHQQLVLNERHIKQIDKKNLIIVALSVCLLCNLL